MAYTRLTVMTGATSPARDVAQAIHDYVAANGPALGWTVTDAFWPAGNNANAEGLDATAFKSSGATNGTGVDYTVLMASSKIHNSTTRIGQILYNGELGFSVMEDWDTSLGTSRRYRRHVPQVRQATTSSARAGVGAEGWATDTYQTWGGSLQNTGTYFTDLTGLAVIAAGDSTQRYLPAQFGLAGGAIAYSTTFDVHISLTAHRMIIFVMSGSVVHMRVYMGLLTTYVEPASLDPAPIALVTFANSSYVTSTDGTGITISGYTRMPNTTTAALFNHTARWITTTSVGVTSVVDGHDLYKGGRPYVTRIALENGVSVYLRTRAATMGAIRGEMRDVLYAVVGPTVQYGDTFTFNGATYVYLAPNIFINTSV